MSSKLAQLNPIVYSDTLELYAVEGVTSEGRIKASSLSEDKSTKLIDVNPQGTSNLTINSTHLDSLQSCANSVILTSQEKGFNLTIHNDSGSASAIDATTNSITILNTSDLNISSQGLIRIIYKSATKVLITGDTEI